MTLRMSTLARTHVMGSGSFKDLFDYGWLRIFSGSQPSDPDTAETGNLMMELSEKIAAEFVADNQFTVSGDQTTIFAEGRTLRAYVGMEASYGTSGSFTVSGDLTETFVEDVSLKADCGADGIKTVTVDNSSHADGVTTVNINESTLTSNLTDVLWAETLTVDSSTYSDPDTTVTINEAVLTDHLSEVMYGIRLGTATSGYIQKAAEATVKGMGKRSGSGGWFRFYPNDLGTGASEENMDGSFGTSGDLGTVSTTIQAGAESTASTVKFTLPQS